MFTGEIDEDLYGYMHSILDSISFLEDRSAEGDDKKLNILYNKLLKLQYECDLICVNRNRESLQDSVVNCVGGDLTIVNSDSDPSYTYNIHIPSGTDQVFVLPKETINIYVNGQLFESVEINVYEGENIQLSIPDGVVEVYNSNGDNVDTVQVPYGQTVSANAPDATVVIENSLGESIGSAGVASGGSTTITIGDTNLTVEYANGTHIESRPVPSNTSDITIVVPNCEDVEITLENTLGNEIINVIYPSGSSYTLVVPDASYTLKDTDNVTIISGLIPSNEAVNITAPDATYTLQNTVLNTLSTGSIVSNGSSTIIAPDATANLKDEDGNPISSTTIPSGSVDTLVAPNGTVIVEYADGTPIQTVNVPSGGNDTVVVPNCQDSTVDIKDTDGNTLYSLNIPSGSSSNRTINDSIAILKDTDGNTLSTTNILAESTEDIIAPDGTVNIESEDGTPIDTVSVMSGETTTVTIPDTEEKKWILQFFNQNNVVIIQVTPDNIATFTSGFGVDVGVMGFSTDGVTYSLMAFPFTPAVGTYYFKRSSSTITGIYELIE